jgi:hypothetical protein
LVRSVRRLELVDGDLEAGLVVGVDHHRHAAGEGDRLGVGGPVRRRQITSSPGSHSTAKALYTACLPPLVTSTWLGSTSKPESRRVLAAIASFSSGSPPAGV